MRNTRIMRSSFTMLELVFVIIITGLVAVAGSMAIVQILQNYALQKEYAKLELDSAAAIRQISKYIQNSLWDSVSIQYGSNYTALYNVNNYESGKIDDSKNTQLIFIEKNIDSTNGRYISTYNGMTYNANVPYFSGFIDLSKSGRVALSNGKVQDGNIVMAALATDNEMSKLLSSANISLNFPFVNTGSSTNQYNKYFTNTNARTAIFKINNINAQTITLQNTPLQIGDIAMIVNTNPSTLKKNSDGELVISQTPLNTINNTVIAKNVSNLYLWTESGAGLIRVRICFSNKIVKSVMNEFCKEGIIMQ